LPVLEQIGARYSKEDLFILAVNTGENQSHYRDFIRSRRYIHVQWARDGSGEIIDMYRVRGIPLTYVLDRDGVIRYVHVGYGDETATALREEVGSLLE
jgi:hypothetical protein